MASNALLTRQRKLAALLSRDLTATPDAPKAARTADPARAQKPRAQRPKLLLGKDGTFGPSLEVKLLLPKQFAKAGWANKIITFRGLYGVGERGGRYYEGRVYEGGRWIGSAKWYITALTPFCDGHRAEKLWVTLRDGTHTRLSLKHELVLERA